MSEKYYPEPWQYDGMCPFSGEYSIFRADANGKLRTIGAMCEDEDAARAVSCVNACAGINPESIKDLLTVCEAIKTLQDMSLWPMDKAMSSLACDAREAFAKAKKGYGA